MLFMHLLQVHDLAATLRIKQFYAPLQHTLFAIGEALSLREFIRFLSRASVIRHLHHQAVGLIGELHTQLTTVAIGKVEHAFVQAPLRPGYVLTTAIS